MIKGIVPNSALLDKGRALAVPAIVILVGVGSFGLGRLSAQEQGRASLAIYAPEGSSVSQTASAESSVVLPRAVATPIPAAPALLSAAASTTIPAVKNFVASKNGTKYYTLGCSGASRIKTENQVWFATASDAQAAGYSLASGCK